MAEANHQPSYKLPPQQRYGQHQQPNQHYAVKAATAVTAGSSLLILSGLVLAGTIIALTIATPLFVIFSPVLVPAVITIALVISGFLTSGGFGVAAITVLAWIYRYATGKQPVGADKLDSASYKVVNKAKEMKDYGVQQVSGTQRS